MLPVNVENQLLALDLDPSRPLIVCDVDEVVVHFLRALEDYLDCHGCWLDCASFALNGNVRLRDTGLPVDRDRLVELLHGCFAERTRTMEAIDGAARALEAFSRDADIVMLTNLPEDYIEDRKVNLASHGMPYQVVANTGPKGHAVAHLIKDRQAPVIFLDDTPTNVVSVAEHCPDVHIVHFMQDERFARHVPPIDGIALRTGSWRDAEPAIADLLACR